MTETVPKEDLEALVAEWREKVDELSLPRSGKTDEAVTYEKCADELAELVDE